MNVKARVEPIEKMLKQLRDKLESKGGELAADADCILDALSILKSEFSEHSEALSDQVKSFLSQQANQENRVTPSYTRDIQQQITQRELWISGLKQQKSGGGFRRKPNLSADAINEIDQKIEEIQGEIRELQQKISA